MPRPFSTLQDSLLAAGEEPPPAAHLVTPRAFYEHHGIYVGGGRVIHYAGLASKLWRGPVEEVSLAAFAHGHCIRVRHDPRRFECTEVLARARSRLSERRYAIFTNNCEHFCTWVLRGEHRSGQVEAFARLPRNLWRLLLATLTPARRDTEADAGTGDLARWSRG
jgi:hypothetical protein